MAKNVIVLGGGGFIGGHLAKQLKQKGNHVRICDIKAHEHFPHSDVCEEFILGDLTDPAVVEKVVSKDCDELYQLAADMGGAEYLFSGLNDANVMSASALINLNVARECVRKNVKKVFYSSSACVYPEFNQADPQNPNCEESSAYPAFPDSEYGWEKLFSERMFQAFQKNYGLDIRIARFHNIFGPNGTWQGGKEKAPAAMLRKVITCENGGEIEVWGDGSQTRSFLYIDDCVQSVFRLMESDFSGPVNIGSEDRVTLNQLAEMAIELSGKDIRIKNLYGNDFFQKYGFPCPLGVKGRNSDNRLFEEKIGKVIHSPLKLGLQNTYNWIKDQVLSLEGVQK
jgi:nucleoside-diphosphate-sugar epimerase